MKSESPGRETKGETSEPRTRPKSSESASASSKHSEPIGHGSGANRQTLVSDVLANRKSKRSTLALYLLEVQKGS